MPMSEKTARAIAEKLLMVTGDALSRGDFEAFADCFLLPQTVHSFTESRVLRTREDMRDVFDKVRANMVADGVERIERYVDEAAFSGPDTIKSTHISQLFLKDGTSQDPYPSMSQIKRVEGEWYIADGQYAVDEKSGHARAFVAQDAAVSDTDRAMMAIFRPVLADLTQAFVDRDFDLLRRHVHLPVMVHSIRAAQVITSEEDLRHDFDIYLAEFEMNGVTDVIRTANSAHAMGDGKLVASYTTHVLSGSSLVTPSFDSSMHMERGTDGVWRVVCVMNSMGHTTLSQNAPGLTKETRSFNVITKPRLAPGLPLTTGDRHV